MTTTQDARRLKLHTTLSLILLAVGAALMTFMITVESEPGLLPLLLVVGGLGWFLVTRARARSLQG